MMKTFLEYVAEDILSKYGNNLSRIAIVFPNKRASLFMSEYLARRSNRPIWSPVYITISELFQRHSHLKVADPIKLVCELHHSFCTCCGKSEPIDQFYGWGEMLLADFDDIDKNMAPAEKVLANIRDLHELDDISYLSEEQITALRHFFSNFTAEHNSELKRRFLELWSHLYDIYIHFNEALQAQGIAYEGAMYRKVVNDETVHFEHDIYVFVGFNFLHQVEQKLFSQLKSEQKAVFYWDFDQYYMSKDGKQNEAGYFIAQYLSRFPNELPIDNADIYNNFSAPKNINYVAATTNNIQARYINEWLTKNHRIDAGTRTAIVLCDESLLLPAIHSLPDEMGPINVTTGYPLALSQLSTLIQLLIQLQLNGYVINADKYRLRYINTLLKHPYIKYITSNFQELFKKLNEDSKVYYPDRQLVSIDSGTELLFRAVYNTPQPLTESITTWLLDILRLIADRSKGTDNAFLQEGLFRMYTLLNRIKTLITTGDLDVNTTTYLRLIKQLIQRETIPFHGEPAIGLQMMGVLETRNLDFDHLLILSCNEGNMPKGISDASFIPYSIRKAYNLTTTDHKVAIYAYYFHRLLQRASDITIVYNCATEEGKSGEMSRFMLQLLVESNHSIGRQMLDAGLATSRQHPQMIIKTPEIIDRLRDLFDLSRQEDTNTDRPLLTPTAINVYQRCPLQFYYRYVCHLKEPDEIDEDEIDNRIFGNIFHLAAETLYGQMSANGSIITREALDYLLKSKIAIENVVDKAFTQELFKQKDNVHFCPEYNGIQLINREVIIHYLRQLIEIDKALTPFSIIGLELNISKRLSVTTPQYAFTTNLGGKIDRLDKIIDSNGQEQIRVIDYKTGRRKPKAFAGIEDIFDAANVREHSDYYLQTLLYASIVSNDRQLNPQAAAVCPALLYIQHTSAEGYDPTLTFGKTPISDINTYIADFEQHLHNKVNEIFNREKPFIPTEDRERCKNCPYQLLCGQS